MPSSEHNCSKNQCRYLLNHLLDSAGNTQNLDIQCQNIVDKSKEKTHLWD